MKKDLKIVVTGSGGFLGSAMTEYLATKPNVSELRALLSLGSQKSFSHLQKTKELRGDLTDLNTARELVSGSDVVLHFANRGFPADGNLNATDYIIENLKVTGVLLEAMRLENVKRIIYASSGGAIYKFDPLRRVPFHEGSEIEFRSPYATAKVSTEHLLHYYKQVHAINPLILRISNPYGVGQVSTRRQGFVGILFDHILTGKDLTIWGTLDICKDFIYIDDLARVYESFLGRPDLSGTFNVGSGIGVTLREVITVAERLTGKKVNLKYTERKPSDCLWTVLNTSKLQRSIHWTCYYNLMEGMRTTWKLVQQSKVQEKKAA